MQNSSNSEGKDFLSMFADREIVNFQNTVHYVFGSVTRVYVPRFFVSSQQRFGATDIKALGAVLQLHFIQKIAGESKTRREESGGVRGEGARKKEREREREREKENSTRTRERVRKKALWLLLLYVFSSTWACPMQIGLSQECCLFCLKFSLWSLDLSLTFLVFQPRHFGLLFPILPT